MLLADTDKLFWFWTALIVIFLITEIATLGLTTIWFAGGAAAALILNAAGAGRWVQICFFLLISFVLLLLVRPIAKGRFNIQRTPTNVDSMIGKEGIVREDICNVEARGCVEVQGQEWSARSRDPDTEIPAGSRVIVNSIEGVKLIVTEKNKEGERCSSH